MTNLEWIKTLSAEELADWFYDEWLPRLQYRWSSSRGGLIIWLKDCKAENYSEKPNNCEHITEDGVTCAKYPACDDCLDNPLNKVKGSERLVKGSEQTEPTISKMEQVDEPQTEEHCETCRHKDECEGATYEYKNTEWWCLGYEPIEDEPQTDCAWR